MKDPNITETGRIADRATFLVERAFERYNFTGNPPKVTPGMVDQVLAAYREVMEGDDKPLRPDSPPRPEDPKDWPVA